MADSKISRIPLFYRIFFLYIDPLINLTGIYIFFFDHATYIQSGVPSALSALLSKTSLSPLEHHLIMALGSYSLCILALQLLLLPQFSKAPNGVNVQIWRILMLGILLTDLGLVYGSYCADPASFFNLGSWDQGDWTNNGILGTLIAIRIAFLLGLGGVGRHEA